MSGIVQVMMNMALQGRKLRLYDVLPLLERMSAGLERSVTLDHRKANSVIWDDEERGKRGGTLVGCNGIFYLSPSFNFFACWRVNCFIFYAGFMSYSWMKEGLSLASVEVVYWFTISDNIYITHLDVSVLS